MLIEPQICFEIKVNTKRIIRTVDEKFVSVAIDTGVMRRHWVQFQSRYNLVLELEL